MPVLGEPFTDVAREGPPGFHLLEPFAVSVLRRLLPDLLGSQFPSSLTTSYLVLWR